MIQIIAGKQGKGKTKYLLAKANEAIKDASGTIVYLDKSAQHMYELNNSIRLINILEYPVDSYEAFTGFVAGLIAQDYDLEQIYFDSFLKIAHVSPDKLEECIEKLRELSDRHNVTLVLSISEDAEFLPDSVKSSIVIAL